MTNIAISEINTFQTIVAKLSQKAFHLVLIVVLVVTYLLLPIERGFPVIRIAGYPITFTILISSVVALVLLLLSNGQILRISSIGYVIAQAIIVWIILLSTVLSEDVEASLFVVLNYFTTFIVNFFILSYLFSRGYRKTFLTILSFAIVLSALIGIIEGLFRYYLPFYKSIYLNHDFARMSYAMSRPDYQALGPLGNSILYSTSLALCVPFILESKRKIVKTFILVMILAAIYYSISLSGFLLLIMLLIGLLAQLRRLPRIILTSFFLLFFSIALIWPQQGSDESIISRWTAKFSSENVNIRTRVELIEWGTEYFLEEDSVSQILVGGGAKSANRIVARVWGEKYTLDNTFVNLLLDTGILGLSAYLYMNLYLIWHFRRSAHSNLHWFNLIGMLLLGFSFETPFYATFNFIWVASVAALSVDSRNSFYRNHYSRT